MTASAKSCDQPTAERQVLDFLRSNAEIRNVQARQLTSITCEIRMNSVFYRIREQGLVGKIEERKGNLTAWRLISSDTAH